MKERYGKITIEAEEGVDLEVVSGGNEALLIKAYPSVSAGAYADDMSLYTDSDGNKALILPGWVVSGIESENTIWGKDKSLVIYQIPKEEASRINWNDSEEHEKAQKKFNQLVWCPVELLDPDGTIDGSNYNQRFGRRNYQDEKFSDNFFKEPLSDEFWETFESVKTHGGFYTSRYHISRNPDTLKYMSVKGAMPLTKRNYGDAYVEAKEFLKGKNFSSHLSFGAEIDSELAWFIKTGSRTLEEVVVDSTEWGNYINSENGIRKVQPTGTLSHCVANNVYDSAGNINVWSQECYESSASHVIRGGNCYNRGAKYQAARRYYIDNSYRSEDLGFKVVVCID